MSFIKKIKFLVGRLTSHKGVMKYTSNTTWLFTEQFLRVVSNLLIGIYVVRHLGPEEFGILSYVLAFVGIFAWISKLGLEEVMVRELVVRPDRQLRYLGTGFWLKCMAGFVNLGVIAAILPLMDNEPIVNFYILLMATAVISDSFIVIESFFHSQVKAKVISICRIIQLSLSGILKLYFIITGADLFYFVLVHVIDLVSLAAFLVIAYFYNNNPSFFGYFSKKYALALLKSSWPLLATTVMVMIYFKVDQLLIKWLINEAEVGIYASASRLVEAYYVVPIVVTASLYPAIIKARELGEKVFLERMQYLVDALLWIAIFVSALVTVLADFIIVLLYGETFRPAGILFAIKIWTAVIFSFGMVWSKWMYSEKRFKVNIVFQAYIFICNIALNLWLIPIYGAKGAAIASLFAISSSYVVLPLLMPSQRKTLKLLFGIFGLKRYLNLWRAYANQTVQGGETGNGTTPP